MFSVDQWQALFNPDLFSRVRIEDQSVPEEQRQMVSQHYLKYLIALDCESDLLSATIQRLTPAEINSKFTIHQITALHIACMKNQKPVVEMLLEQGADITTEDQYGWSCLHHAALVSSELTDLILRNMRSLKNTRLDGTYENITRLTRNVGNEPNLFPVTKL